MYVIEVCMNVKKILVIKFSALGDLVHSSVIPVAIKEQYPEVKIHYLTTKNNARLLENCACVDKILTYDGNFIECLRNIFQEGYDVVFCLNYTMRCYLFSFFSFAKKVVFRKNEYNSLVENYFYTAKSIFKNIDLPARLFLDNTDSVVVEAVKQKIKDYPRPYIVINPGKYNNNPRQGRIWNIKNWAELAKELLSSFGGTVFVNGSMSERDYHIQLSDDRIVVLSGLLKLKESCAMLSMADLVISGDSGPVHIASAYNVKTLSLLGSTSPDKIKPYGDNGFYVEPDTECKYCWKKKCKYTQSRYEYAPCIESITVEKVMKKIRECCLLKNEAPILSKE